LRKGASLAVVDFPSQPIRLYNFAGGALTDQGSANVPVAPVGGGTITDVAGADGTVGNGKAFSGAHTGLGSSDAGLPAALATRSFGCWFKGGAASQCLINWGNTSGLNSEALWLNNPNGFITSRSNGAAADDLLGTYGPDGLWHFVVVVCDNAAGDGNKRKLYVDGKLVASSTVLNSITLTGANHFRIACFADNGFQFSGQMDSVFVTGVALTLEQIAALYAKGSQSLGPSPKNPGDHVEAFDAAAVYATFDTLESQYQIDLGVSS
jgi:hypothetical protein